eukprot:6465190-Amphidinium_carterae.1
MGAVDALLHTRTGYGEEEVAIGDTPVAPYAKGYVSLPANVMQAPLLKNVIDEKGRGILRHYKSTML